MTFVAIGALRVKNGPCQSDKDDFQDKRMMVPNTIFKMLPYCSECYNWLYCGTIPWSYYLA